MTLSAADNSAAPLDAAFFERLFRGAGLAVFACDAQGRVRAWNTMAELLLRPGGWHEGALLVEALPEADRPAFEEALRACAEQRGSQEVRTRLPLNEREYVDYAVWFTPMPSEDGRLEGVVVWFHDITARVQHHQSRRKQQKLSSLGELSGAVAHHYSNLLCSIVTSIEYANNMNTMAAMRRALGRTADAVARAAQLTRQLLAFAQADHQARDQADLTEAVLYYFDENETRLREHNIELDMQWSPVPMMAVPRENITTIIEGIVDNAIDVMPEGGTLLVRFAHEEGRMARLSISDTGPGIRPEQLEHLFEPFFTTKGELSAGDSRRKGMGLAVAYGLVNELAGTIVASNVPGAGARFDVLIPCPAPDAPAAAPPACEPQ